MPRRAQPEQQLQQAVARFLALALPEGSFFTAFPAGGGGRLRGAFLRSMGLRAGVPDLMIIWQGHYHGIELKAEGGRATNIQKLCAATIEYAGGRVAVCRSLQDVQETLAEWGIPLKARVETA